MEYRPIRPDEVDQHRELQEYCFLIPHDDFQPYMTNKFSPEPVRGLFEDGRMLAVLTNHRFELYVDGARIPMGGIAGVASPPEYRRSGNVGKLLQECIRETREQGVPLSGLYPFKQAFYRRYGWEVSSAWHVTEIPVELLSAYRGAGGTITRFPLATEDWAELAAIYDRWARARRGAMVRPTQKFWHDWVNAPWRRESERLHAAVWRPEPQAQPEGYLLYKFEKRENHQRLWIKELIALTPQAERALWGFAAQHDSMVKEVALRTGREFPIGHLVEDTSPVKQELKSGPMLRIVDVKGAFEARPWPAALSGSISIDFADEHAPWNQSTWRITFADGRASVAEAPADTADLGATVQTWSQMYAGFVGPARQARSQRLAVSNPAALDLLERALAGDEFFYYEFY